MNMKKLTILILIGITVGSSLKGQINKKISTIDSMINIYTHYYGFCGTVLIEKKGKLILNKGYGYSSYELNIPASDSTKYHICSISKGFTRVLIDGLINEDKIKLDDKLFKYLPEIGEKIGNAVQIKHLLIHQSGLEEHFFDPLSRNTKIDNIKSIKDSKLLFEPGSKEEYCNLNYYILGIIIERLTGHELAFEYNEKIFKPLGMTDSYLDNVERMLKNMAVPHYTNQVNQDDMFIHVYPKPNDKGFAAGGIIMTTQDLYKWIKAFHSNKFGLKVDDLRNDNSNNYGKAYENYSLGWETNGIKRRYIEGDGIGEGFRSLYLYFPDDSLTILFLNNSYYFPADYNTNRNYVLFDNVVYRSADIMLDRKFTLPELPVGQLLIEKIKKGNSVDAIVNEYNKLKNDSKSFIFDVKQLNRVAYFYLKNNNLDNAFKIFTLNLSEYPDSWIANDGIGEYFLRKGDRTNAIKYLDISLTNNPNKRREERKMHDIRRDNIEILKTSN